MDLFTKPSRLLALLLLCTLNQTILANWQASEQLLNEQAGEEGGLRRLPASFHADDYENKTNLDSTDRLHRRTDGRTHTNHAYIVI